MKPRRWLTWLIFTICAIALLEALAWLTWQAIRLEEGERRARAEAAFQETIRLAMWRLESEVIPLLYQEATRPYFHYLPFFPAGRQYSRMLLPLEPGDVSVASPLLETGGPYIKLYFQLEPNGRLSSPQAPTGEMRQLAESRYIDPEFLVLASERLNELSAIVAGGFAFAVRMPNPTLEPEALQYGEAQKQAPQQRTAQEFAARQQAAQVANVAPEQGRPRAQTMGKSSAQRFEDGSDADFARGALQRYGASDHAGDVRQGSLAALWVRNPATQEKELLLHRRVDVAGTSIVQGFWMDWPALRARLQSVVVDLLPDVDLAPAGSEILGRSPASHLMATIPVLLAPGDATPLDEAGLTPMMVTFVFTWLAVLAAVVAIAVVLRKSMELSDRRGRFVSAVTHELRTPLTTFCMYTEMLAAGMVADEESRRGYLGTLKAESRRLAGIVENVLEYARLGGKKPSPAGPPIMARDLVSRIEPALAQCAERCGMKLMVEGFIDPSLCTSADIQTVERILLNLVDNACKYASEARDRRLHLTAVSTVFNGHPALELRVRDHGPGIPPREARRIFKPFSRARRESNGPKSGLGLGLALSRGLARELGGDLHFVPPADGGAEFVLRLPA
jgi:signal transduction histidine kinase